MKATPEQISYIRQCSEPHKHMYEEDRHTCVADDLTNQIDMESTETHVNTMQNSTNVTGLQGMTAAIKSAIRSIQVDTGTDASLVGTDQDGNLTNRQPAHAGYLWLIIQPRCQQDGLGTFHVWY